MTILREKIQELRRVTADFPALVLTGARQVGKTTLLRELFPNHAYVSLDLPSLAALAEENPDQFLLKYPPPLIVDEVQYAPQLFRHLKIWIDQNRHQKGSIILTGSQKFSLMKEVSDSLAGRIAVCDLSPLSLYEIDAHQKINPSELLGVISRGFFPELWKERDRLASDYYRSYVATYIERDVRQIINITHRLDFERFFKICASRTGQVLNKTEIAKDVGVTQVTINKWLSVLEASNQITLLPPYFENFGKRVIKMPKIYFNDTGLALYLLGLNESALLNSPILGAIWETMVFNELKKRWQAGPPEGEFYYYRDSNAREIDILFVKNGKVDFIETKWTTAPDIKTAKKILAVAKDLKSKIVEKGECVVISRTENPYSITEGVLTTSLFDYKLRS